MRFRWLAAGLIASSAACIGSSSNPAGPGEPDQWTVSVTLTNVGNAAGRVAVEPSTGTVTEACPDPILPGRSCRVAIEHRQAIGSVELTADPEDGAEFAGYAGACTGTGSECRIQVPRESSVSIRVDVTFVLAGPGKPASRTP